MSKKTKTKKRKLPPDPDGKNGDRALWAQDALDAMMVSTGADREDACSDLIANLMHWCDRNDTTFEAELARAQFHYDAETGGEGS